MAAGLVGAEIAGVCLPRSGDVVVALLAAWHAGAAYLPLDPEYPQQRRELMIADSGASVVVTGVDAFRAAVAAHDIGCGTPAYVIYTSGSTGVPKGVAVTHANLAARVRWMGTRTSSAPTTGSCSSRR